MDILNIWFLASNIDKLCLVHQFIEDANTCEKETAIDLIEEVIQSLQDEMTTTTNKDYKKS